MGSLAGKAVVITGSGRGIGAAYARLAAAEGARVVVNDIDPDSAHRTVREIRAADSSASAFVGDISSWQVAADLVQFCVAEYGAVDGWINNAGLFHMATPEEENERDLRRIVEVNLLGSAFCGLHAIRQMRRQGRGAIVNVTSGAQAGINYAGAYSATKGAVASMTYSWAADLVGSGIRVNAISPMARSAMGDSSRDYFLARGKTPWPDPAATPEDNAPVACYLLSDYAAKIHGQVVRIDGKRLSLMTHPAVLHPPIDRAYWTVDAVREAFEQDLEKKLLPLGTAALEATVRPYELSYRVSQFD